MTDRHTAYLSQAVELSRKNVAQGGRPFGSIIVRDDTIIATGMSSVMATLDPTAHAEIQAIRAACQTLRTPSLRGCRLYTSSEPCPMCLGAIFWTKPDAVYYANTRQDTAEYYEDFYPQYPLDPAARTIPMTRIVIPNARQVLQDGYLNELWDV